jgi:hypothetical protein
MASLRAAVACVLPAREEPPRERTGIQEGRVFPARAGGTNLLDHERRHRVVFPAWAGIENWHSSASGKRDARRASSEKSPEASPRIDHQIICPLWPSPNRDPSPASGFLRPQPDRARQADPRFGGRIHRCQCIRNTERGGGDPPDQEFPWSGLSPSAGHSVHPSRAPRRGFSGSTPFPSEETATPLR